MSAHSSSHPFDSGLNTPQGFVDELRISQFRSKASPRLAARNISDLQCMRFINARRADGLEAALAMAEAWAVWRSQPLSSGGKICPDSVLRDTNEDNLSNSPHRELFPFALHGEDLEGHPIYWERNGRITANFPQIKQHFTVTDLIIMHIR